MTKATTRVALVTGAASGFGAGIAKKLASQAIAVVVADLAEENGRGVVEEIKCNGGSAIFVKMNVTRRESWEDAIKIVLDNFGHINFVVNNAGGTYPSKHVYETTEADFDKCIDLNLRSIFHSVHVTMPLLQQASARGEPAVMVNIASTGGVKGRPGLEWYSASKAGAISATQSLAHAVASDQVRVNCVCPVLGNTPLMGAFIGEANVEHYAKSIPLGRFAEPSDIANATAFLCSDDATFLTGVVLPVDGGRLA